MRSLDVGALGADDIAALELALTGGRGLSALCAALGGLPGSQRAKGTRPHRLATGVALASLWSCLHVLRCAGLPVTAALLPA